MSAAASAAGSGAVLGLVAVFLGQQLGFLQLSDLTRSIEYLVVGALIGGVLFGILGWLIGKRRQPRPSPPPTSEDS